MAPRSANAESRDNSPDRDGSPDKRPSKKRKVLSCYACRNRKMKCDRVYPVCGRCQKNGRGDQCTYDPRLLEDAIGNNGVADGSRRALEPPDDDRNQQDFGPSLLGALQWKTRTQERRIQELERRLASAEQYVGPSRYKPVQFHGLDDKEEMMFRGKGFKTSFHGATSVMSTIAQYREMQAFTREALMIDHSIKRIRTDFKTFRDRRKIMLKQLCTKIHGSNEEIFTALPERPVLDVQVAVYFQTCESTYRILHEPSFWNEYQKFWDNQTRDDGSVGFAVILVLIFVITKCLSPKDDVFDGDTTAGRQEASNLVDVCDAWNARQPRKRLTLQFFQIQCLSLLAKRVNCVRLKQDWVTSGDLVRLALAAGMHRDPALLVAGKVSPFEKEMKKRLWVTIMELELQASLECGLQSSLSALYWDTPSPANLSDDSFASDTEQLPIENLANQFTSVSYLCAAFRSLPLRIHLTQLLNDPSSNLQYEEVLQYDAQIHESLSILPSWDDPRAAIPSSLLRLQFQQYLLLLHKSYARAAHTQHRYMHSFAQCVDAANSIAVINDDLISKGMLFLNHMRNDAVRVSLTLSEIIYHNCTKRDAVALSAPTPAAHAHAAELHTHFADLPRTKEWATDMSLALPVLPREPFLARALCISGIETLYLAVQACEQKVMRLGTAYMEFWLLSAAVGMLPPLPNSGLPATSIAHITTSDDDVEARCRKTLDRFQTLAFRVLSMQKDPGNIFATSLRTTMASVSPSDKQTPSVSTLPTGNGFGATPAASGEGPYTMAHGMDSYVDSNPVTKDMVGAFDNLQDMQVDLGGWNFPDFWAFDLGGEF